MVGVAGASHLKAAMVANKIFNLTLKEFHDSGAPARS